MIIFTCSAQHAAINSGQVSHTWIPGIPIILWLAPPTAKGQTELAASLPEVNATHHTLVLLWGVTFPSPSLDTYPEEHCTEKAPRRSIAALQSRLAQMLADVLEWNRGLALPYSYLDRAAAENGIAARALCAHSLHPHPAAPVLPPAPE
uniref:Lipoxygenase domain-containing protein n=1 Tax=Piliocolobus tephrosceles TaxID=591936 RepID=A0A8C9GPF8_9PRIM